MCARPCLRVCIFSITDMFEFNAISLLAKNWKLDSSATWSFRHIHCIREWRIPKSIYASISQSLLLWLFSHIVLQNLLNVWKLLCNLFYLQFFFTSLFFISNISLSLKILIFNGVPCYSILNQEKILQQSTHKHK